MGANFIDNNTETVLKYAMSLEKSGLGRAAEGLFRKCAKAAATSDDGEDVLAMIYGDGIYNSIKNVRDSLDCILMAQCVSELYRELKERNPAASSFDSATAWAVRDNDITESAMVDFFSWLFRKKERVSPKDRTVIASAILAIREGILVKMDESVASMYPVSVVKGAVSGRITMVNRELRYNGYN